MAAFPLSIPVAAERMSNLLMPMNNLDSNICTFILWAAPFQHPANKHVPRAWQVLCVRLGDGALLSLTTDFL